MTEKGVDLNSIISPSVGGNNWLINYKLEIWLCVLFFDIFLELNVI